MRSYIADACRTPTDTMSIRKWRREGHRRTDVDDHMRYGSQCQDQLDEMILRSGTGRTDVFSQKLDGVLDIARERLWRML